MKLSSLIAKNRKNDHLWRTRPVLDRFHDSSKVNALCSVHAEAQGSTRKPSFKKFLQLFMALLTIFCGSFLMTFYGFVDNFYGFLDDFLQLFLFCFLCSTNIISAVQKSDYLFYGNVCVKVSPRTALLLSKSLVGLNPGGQCSNWVWQIKTVVK